MKDNIWQFACRSVRVPGLVGLKACCPTTSMLSICTHMWSVNKRKDDEE